MILSEHCRFRVSIFHGACALMQSQPLLFLGDGPFAVEALDIAEAAGGFAPLGFVNSVQRPVSGSTLAGLPIFWIDDIPCGPNECDVVCAIVTSRQRASIQI